jgi:hypothetical protein
MSLANTGANTIISGNVSALIQVANVETLITGVLPINAANLANGHIVTVSLFGAVGGPAYNLNIRVGANGNTTDNVVYSQATAVTGVQLANDVSAWANSNPGFGPNLYPGPSIPVGPALKLNGTFYMVAQNVGAHANFMIVDPAGVLGNTNYQANTATFDSTAAQKLTISHSVVTNPVLTFKGYGAGMANTPGSAFSVGASTAKVANSSISIAKVEIVALPS